MSGFFSLGQKDQEQDQQNHSFFLSKNEEVYNKGFELWQQYYQLHQQRHQDANFSIGPSNNIINFSNIGDERSNYSYRSEELGFREIMSQGRGGSDTINCQDCGNQAKKDCQHMRCRTCCKSRGFPCQTHVKSTWVPAAKRRERQQQLSTLQQDQMIRAENLKRLRENRRGGGGSGSGSGGGFESGHFPSEVNSSAVFRCVRVSAADEAEDTLAYQTAVNIGGHVFKGILYDQGSESRYHGGGGEGSSGAIGGSQQHSLDLIAATAPPTSTATTGNMNVTMLDPSIYSAQFSGYMPGTQFFLSPRP